MSDELWSSLSRCRPSRGRSWSGARPRAPGRQTSRGVPFVSHSGRPAPEPGSGSRMTCWRRLAAWNEVGVWDQLHAVLLKKLR
ncbi:transposase [Streptomyces olivaceoviridis]